MEGQRDSCQGTQLVTGEVHLRAKLSANRRSCQQHGCPWQWVATPSGALGVCLRTEEPGPPRVPGQSRTHSWRSLQTQNAELAVLSPAWWC